MTLFNHGVFDYIQSFFIIYCFYYLLFLFFIVFVFGAAWHMSRAKASEAQAEPSRARRIKPSQPKKVMSCHA